MTETRNIILIGFKSCGKTTVGKLLSSQVGFTFTDLDDSIHNILGVRYKIRWNCWEFYSTYGAAKFREVETEALRQHMDDHGIVLATGGGAPLLEENRTLLSQLGIVCYIKAPAETIFERFKRNGMPAYLERDASVEKLKRIWQKRDVIYSDLADITIEAGEQEPQQICAALMNELAGKL